MSANLSSTEQTFADRLDKFDRRIKAQDDTGQLVEEIHATITILMTKAGSDEDRMRELLQRRYNAGKLRLETYQLVRDVLDRVASESMATMPEALEAGTDGGTEIFMPAAESTSAPPDDLQVGAVLRDRFLLQERVAGGSMGIVYKALDRRLAEAEGFDPWVAIKVLSPKLSRNAQALRALQQEAAKGRALNHPNIVRFVDLDRDGDVYFIVMEWLDGRPLAAILDEDHTRQTDLPTALDIVRQVGDALDYAHRSHVIHADVKPANVMVLPSGRVKLFDFGIARIRQRQHQLQKDFDPGVLGAVTPAYSSIQVLAGEDPTPADDVFSLGCLMYRMVAGHRVFGPRNAAEAAEQGMEPQRPEVLNDTQWRALRKALSFSQAGRYATPKEFLEALATKEAPVRLAAEPIVVEPKEPPPPVTRRWGLAIGGLVALGVVLSLMLQPEWVREAEKAARTWFEPTPTEVDTRPAPAPVVREPEPEPEAAMPETGVADQPTPVPDGGEDNERTAEPPAASGLPETEVPGPAPEEPPAAEEIIDFSTLPPASAVVSLPAAGGVRSELDLTLREDEGDVIVDFVRDSIVGEPLTLRIEEVGFSGNQSPWGSGRLQLANDGIVHFPAGQNRARMTLSMPSNSRREADREAVLLVRNVDVPGSELAILDLTLEDDDQRAFEADLPVNSVGFSVAEVVVRESDPAILIDVLRFNPDDNELEVRYRISGGTATEGEDYFLPGATALVYGPRQRSARMLIPLVQDAEFESDETFTLEIVSADSEAPGSVHQAITVIIADDDGSRR